MFRIQLLLLPVSAPALTLLILISFSSPLPLPTQQDTSKRQGTSSATTKAAASTIKRIDEEAVAASQPEMTGEYSTDPNGTIAAIKDINYYRNEIKKEKAGKRKLFHALHKLAGELKKVKKKSAGLQDEEAYRNTAWYQGGLWRAPQVLPEAQREVSTQDRTRPRDAISLSDMFFNLVVVVGFTRVGLAITHTSQIKAEDVLYFATFWTIWGKEASYSSRFDTTDLSAKVETLLSCFAVLFASLSVSLPMDSEGGARIMYMAGFVSFLHFCLMARVLWWYREVTSYSVDQHVRTHALYNTLMNLLETCTWILGAFLVPVSYRWIVFIVAVALALRVPRAFLANDFHGAFLWLWNDDYCCNVVRLPFLIPSFAMPGWMQQLPIHSVESFSFYCSVSCCRVSSSWRPTFSNGRRRIGSNTRSLEPAAFSFSVSSSCTLTTPTRSPLITPSWSIERPPGSSILDNLRFSSPSPLWAAV